MTLGIIGAGGFGTALGHVVASTRGTDVRLWCEDPAAAHEIREQRTLSRRLPGISLDPRLLATTNLAEVTAACRLLVLAVPSRRVVDTVRALGELVTGEHLVVHAIGAPADLATGGDSLPVRVSELIRRETSVRRVGVLAGPAMPQDLLAGHPCAVVAASAFDEVVVQTRAALDSPARLRVYGSRDLLGVELAAGLSGALTVAIGLGDGLKMGEGPRAVLVCRGVAEATRLVVAAGGQEKTFQGLAGLGNLLVRATSSSSGFSDDYALGVELAQGKGLTRPETSGSRAAAALVRLAGKLGVRLPLVSAVAAVVYDKVPIAAAAAKLQESTGNWE